MLRLSAKAVLLTLVGVAVVVGIGLGIMYLTGTLQKETADFRGGVAELEQIKADPAHRISARQYFFETCAAVQAQEDRIAILESELDTDPSEQRVGEINGALTAVRSIRAELIREYNTHADNFTFEQFRDADLPEELNSDAESTDCSA